MKISKGERCIGWSPGEAGLSSWLSSPCRIIQIVLSSPTNEVRGPIQITTNQGSSPKALMSRVFIGGQS